MGFRIRSSLVFVTLSLSLALSLSLSLSLLRVFRMVGPSWVQGGVEETMKHLPPPPPQERDRSITVGMMRALQKGRFFIRDLRGVSGLCQAPFQRNISGTHNKEP